MTNYVLVQSNSPYTSFIVPKEDVQIRDNQYIIQTMVYNKVQEHQSDWILIIETGMRIHLQFQYTHEPIFWALEEKNMNVKPKIIFNNHIVFIDSTEVIIHGQTYEILDINKLKNCTHILRNPVEILGAHPGYILRKNLTQEN